MCSFSGAGRGTLRVAQGKRARRWDADGNRRSCRGHKSNAGIESIADVDARSEQHPGGDTDRYAERAARHGGR